ncbi:FAD-binding domain-containing protein [Agrocybe pediades]|nr:FAD-binding domain-containing protein [Agrocybe pediades]
MSDSQNSAQSSLVIKGDVVTPGNPTYKEAIARWAANAERKAKIVAFVKDDDDVVTSIKFARENSLPIAVRGGGHSAGAASSVEDGLVIDLSRYLNGATVDPEKKLVYVGGGALWEAVDKAAIKHGLATVGGTVNHVRLSLVLGGGYGWLSGAHGLAIDNLVQVTIVTAEGSILIANEEQNPDLFFAVRGGGGNFGVVTEFVLKLHPQRATVYSGLLIFPPPKMGQIIEATNEWLKTNRENQAMFQVSTPTPDGMPAFGIIPFYNGSESEGREKFKFLFDIGPVADMTKEIPFEELNALQNPMTMHGKGVYQKGVAHIRPHPEAVVQAHDRLMEIVKEGHFIGQIIYEYVPLDKINSVPTHATAFRREITSNILVNLTWDQSIQDRTEGGRKIAKELTSILAGSASDLTISQSLGYSNYDPDYSAGRSTDGAVDKAKLTFGENYPRLQAIKRKYDPDNVFDKWFPITPA